MWHRGPSREEAWLGPLAGVEEGTPDALGVSLPLCRNNTWVSELS